MIYNCIREPMIRKKIYHVKLFLNLNHLFFINLGVKFNNLFVIIHIGTVACRKTNTESILQGK